MSLNWRRASRRWHSALVPLGLVTDAAARVLCGLLPRGGGSGGAWLCPAMAVAGVGPTYGPNLNRALERFAADADGLLVTVTQPGQLVDVATLGTLCLNRLSYYARSAPGTAASCAHAPWLTTVALAGTAPPGVFAGAPLSGRRTPGPAVSHGTAPG
ncbi:hypothetical protein [Streptomyces silvisoli]|uniref:Uncharacterized protein n=1 Tax=Streptomyces silvisoli TaxID=3034235 RepID=A0ABT5ZEK4_9ACTN|nr:hypothetical protein [Streptomyces silvisoli]MDF3288227.1 hypothetical protein [Streptomyces silvisoli]